MNASTQVLFDSVTTLLTPADLDSTDFQMFTMDYAPIGKPETRKGGVVYHLEALLDDVAYAKALQFEADWCAANNVAILDGPSERQAVEFCVSVDALINRGWETACRVAAKLQYVPKNLTTENLQEALNSLTKYNS